MTKKEICKMIEAVPDDIVEEAYALDPYLKHIQLFFDSEIVRSHLLDSIPEAEKDGCISFLCLFGDTKWKVILT